MPKGNLAPDLHMEKGHRIDLITLPFSNLLSDLSNTQVLQSLLNQKLLIRPSNLSTNS
jgi:hypothetical protein